MKNIITLTVLLTLAVSLCSCGKNGEYKISNESILEHNVYQESLAVGLSEENAMKLKNLFEPYFEIREDMGIYGVPTRPLASGEYWTTVMSKKEKITTSVFFAVYQFGEDCTISQYQVFTATLMLKLNGLAEEHPKRSLFELQQMAAVEMVEDLQK